MQIAQQKAARDDTSVQPNPETKRAATAARSSRALFRYSTP